MALKKRPVFVEERNLHQHTNYQQCKFSCGVMLVLAHLEVVAALNPRAFCDLEVG